MPLKSDCQKSDEPCMRRKLRDHSEETFERETIHSRVMDATLIVFEKNYIQGRIQFTMEMTIVLRVVRIVARVTRIEGFHECRYLYRF